MFGSHYLILFEIWGLCSLFHLTMCSHSMYIHIAVSWANLRIPGVLQRLAWSYLVVACLDLLVARSHLDILTRVSQQLSFTHS